MRTETTVQNKGKSHIPTSGDDEDEHIQLKRTSFSGKKKKDLLKAKRKIKEARRQTALRNDNDERTRFYEDFHGIESTIIKEPTKARNNLKCSTQDLGAETGLLSVFQKESDLDVAERKKDARIQYCTISPGPFGIAIDDANKMQSIQMPIRPQWNAGDTRSEADAREKSYFETYVKLLHGLNEKQLNPFEMNLEVWRQLWRVVERSDILLVVVDIRFPRLNFPRAFYELLKHQSTSEVLGKDHIKADTPDLNASNCSHATPRKLIGSTEKSMVIVLNKVDLISRDVADKWLDWFEEEYAGVTVLCMSSLPSENDSPFRDNKATDAKSLKNRDRSLFGKSMRTLRPYGEESLLDAIRYELSKTFDGHPGIDLSAVSFEPTHLTKSVLQKDLDISNDQYSSVEVGKPAAGDNNYEIINASITDDLNENEGDDNDNENKIIIKPTAKEDKKPRVNWQPDSDGTTQFQCNESHIIPKMTSQVCKGIQPQRAGERSSFVTIGLVGHPNAGKSSLINALAGRKVVSVSSTPGHTKHLQTIFLNPSTRLCDCPGLVFPTVGVPYPLQVLGGQVNTAQVRETFSTLAYVGARYPLERSYNLDPPVSGCRDPTSPSPTEEKISIQNGEDLEGCSIDRNTDNIGKKNTKILSKWSGFSLAEAYAIKRGYYTKKQIPDAHRAGNEILRDLQNGKIVFSVSPPLSNESIMRRGIGERYS